MSKNPSVEEHNRRWLSIEREISRLQTEQEDMRKFAQIEANWNNPIVWTKLAYDTDSDRYDRERGSVYLIGDIPEDKKKKCFIGQWISCRLGSYSYPVEVCVDLISGELYLKSEKMTGFIPSGMNIENIIPDKNTPYWFIELLQERTGKLYPRGLLNEMPVYTSCVLGDPIYNDAYNETSWYLYAEIPESQNTELLKDGDIIRFKDIFMGGEDVVVTVKRDVRKNETTGKVYVISRVFEDDTWESIQGYVSKNIKVTSGPSWLEQTAREEGTDETEKE